MGFTKMTFQSATSLTTVGLFKCTEYLNSLFREKKLQLSRNTSDRQAEHTKLWSRWPMSVDLYTAYRLNLAWILLGHRTINFLSLLGCQFLCIVARIVSRLSYLISQSMGTVPGSRHSRAWTINRSPSGHCWGCSAAFTQRKYLSQFSLSGYRASSTQGSGMPGHASGDRKYGFRYVELKQYYNHRSTVKPIRYVFKRFFNSSKKI